MHLRHSVRSLPPALRLANQVKNTGTPESKELSERHYLELSKNEEDLLEMIKTKGFKKIVVLINSGNAFECAKLDADDKVDAILWMGVPGANGAAAASFARPCSARSG